MKKIMISLLMVAATLSATAQTFSGFAELTLKSSDNKSCTMIIAQSNDLTDGLNDGYYAELNESGYDVQLYVVHGGKKYQQFASSESTMTDLQLGIKTNAATSYTLTAANVTGAMKIKVNGVEYTITDGMSEAITLPASSTLPAAGDEAKYKINPSAPLVQAICFNYNKLQLTKYDGATVEVFADGAATAALTQVVSGDAQFDIDLSTLASGKYKVVVSGIATPEEYIIDVKPAVTVVP